MKKTLLLERGILPEDIDRQNFYDFWKVINTPAHDLTDPAKSGSAYNDTQWVDQKGGCLKWLKFKT